MITRRSERNISASIWSSTRFEIFTIISVGCISNSAVHRYAKILPLKFVHLYNKGLHEALDEFVGNFLLDEFRPSGVALLVIGGSFYV